MSAGTVHSKASKMLSAGFVLGTLFTLNPINIQFAIGPLIGIFVMPDCDVDAGTIAEKIIRNKVGRFAEKAWRLLWHFYRRSLKHGGELSHFPVISTMGRIVYLYTFLIVLPCILISGVLFLMNMGWDFRGELSWWWNWILGYWRIIVGLMGADLIHWALDICTTEHKKPTIQKE